MDRGLVVVERTEAHHGLLEEAMEHAAGADASLVLLTTMSEEEYESDAETLESIGSIENISYDSDASLDAAVSDVQEFVSDVGIDRVDVEIVARATDNPSDVVIEVADEHQCDHIFVLGQRRSPTGKALFGDIAQQIALNFDGYVTLATN